MNFQNNFVYWMILVDFFKTLSFQKSLECELGFLMNKSTLLQFMVFQKVQVD
jgi:hypothetical protein